MIVDGEHEPIIDLELWNKVQERLQETKRLYGRYQRREQPVQFMLKGLVRCSSCGATLVMQSTSCMSMQCHNYARGTCGLSHSLSINKANKAVVSALEQAVNDLSFTVEPASTPKESANSIDYDKLIKSEKLKLQKIKEAYLSGVDSLEEYKQNKATVQETICRLKEEKESKQSTEPASIDKNVFAKKVLNVLEFIKSPDVTEQAKNEALRSIISKIIYVKPENRLDIIFYI